MIHLRLLAVFALAAGLFLAAGSSPGQNPVQPKVFPLPGQPAAGGQPVIVGGGELPVVPKSAPMFLSVKVSAIVDHPDLKPVLEHLKKTPEGLDGVIEMLGVAPQEMDRITLFWPTLSRDLGAGNSVLVVTTREAYNEARVLKSLKAEPVFDRDWQRDGGGGRWRHDNIKPPPPAAKSSEPFPPPEPPKGPPKEEDECSATVPITIDREPIFYGLPRGPFGILFLVDDRTLVFLPETFGDATTNLALLAQLMQKKPTGPLAEAIAAGAAHTLAAGVHLQPLFRGFEGKLPQEMAPYAALLAARTAVVTGNLDKSARLTLTLSFDDAAAARRAAPVLEEGLKALAARATELVAEMKESNRPQEKGFVPIVEAVAAGLKNATTKANGAAVVAAVDVEVGPAAGKAAAELIQSLATQKKFLERTNNLKQIGLALHNYHDAMGRLPTNVYNAKGEAILSWRVQLLPFFEEDNLWKQFKMDEPWDGPNNKKLIEQMPKVFTVPGREAPKGKTYLQGFVSPNPQKRPPGGMFFNPSWLVEGEKQGRTLGGGIPDGTSNTIAVAEAREAVIWSKPEDLPFGEKLPLLGEERADRFAVLMFDGSTRMLSAKIDAQILRALITVAGGEVVPDLDDRPRRRVPEEAPRAVPPGKGGGGAGEARPPRGDQLLQELAAARAEADLRTVETQRLERLFAQGVVKREDLLQSKAVLAVALARVAEIEALIRKLEEAEPGRTGKTSTPPPVDKK